MEGQNCELFNEEEKTLILGPSHESRFDFALTLTLTHTQCVLTNSFVAESSSNSGAANLENFVYISSIHHIASPLTPQLSSSCLFLFLSDTLDCS